MWAVPGERAAAPEGAPRGLRANVQTHARFPQDEAAVRAVLERMQGLVDLGEPFTRIREAIGEARKMGVTSRA